MANWNLPGLTDLYANFLTYLKGRDDDAVRLNDTRIAAPDNPPSYAKRWNDSTQTFQNWWSSVWSNLIIGVAGGGTGSATAAGARTNLSVYSIAAVDAAFLSSITVEVNVLGGNVTLTNQSTYYDGPSVSLGAGTWFIIGVVNLSIQGGYPERIYMKMWDGTTAFTNSYLQIPTDATVRQHSHTLMYATTFGATTLVRLAASREGASTGSYMHAGLSVIYALKVG